MSQLQAIKERREAVRSTQKITTAMKMIAVSRLRAAQRIKQQADAYVSHIERLFQVVVAQSSQAFGRYTQSPDVQKDLYIIVAANRGLCGSYNQNIFRMTTMILEQNQGTESSLDVITLGKKGGEFIGRCEDVDHIAHYPLGDTPDYSQIEGVIQHVLPAITAGTYRKVICLGTRYRSALLQEAQAIQIFPYEYAEAIGVLREISVDPDLQTGADHLWGFYLRSKLYECILQSVTSEHAARMRAMDGASRNATEMIEELTLRYNRQRQSTITSELIEIIAGSESMKGEN
ncbi:MAG: ATP synthase F1 subunit gamma [Alphaproteobacteria bacterium]|nr:MAG: ATP synthase F1 subunit gamma [Alphaproteobacteria bacterium]